jgi:hypothetical protein
MVRKSSELKTEARHQRKPATSVAFPVGTDKIPSNGIKELLAKSGMIQ